ncbi:hypothetical protein EIP91_000279 [Steccherinum ochraceum]|uniref:Extracellular membrane protein CFEM domain-containing protein n=1 Tax=Steccherinum ochraceum TaxID=92696 RepID=A0A4R0RPP2_9APHY|nr:hypothetical protein EIP91_000279 [Steccherinum ochraceum]
MPGRPLLPLEIGLLLLSISSTLLHSSLGQITNENASCVGNLAPLNSNAGDSPCKIFQNLQSSCSPSNTVGYAPTACVCNSIAYNLGNACLLCGNGTLMSWTQWAQDWGCAQSFIPSQPAYQLPSEGNIPKWAFKTLASPDDTFDANAALQTATHKGWSTIQIVLPIISAVAALLVAGLVFYCWRRSKTRPQRQRYWQDARLHGPRRFFGLFPDILRVRKQTVDTQWEIDNAAARGVTFSPPGGANGAPYDPHDDAAHSRTTSLSSLLPTTSRPPSSLSSRSSSALSNFLAKFSWSSSSPNSTLSKTKYKKGVAKAPEYRRVNVVADSRPAARFKIDGEVEAGAARGAAFALSTGEVGPSGNSEGSRASTLPSVLDIRLPSRKDTASDFTLTTNDLNTPTDGAFSVVQSNDLRPPSPHFSVRADSNVLPFASTTSLAPIADSSPPIQLPQLKPNRR